MDKKCHLIKLDSKLYKWKADKRTFVIEYK